MDSSRAPNQTRLYDSGYHDADIDWSGRSNSIHEPEQDLVMESDGSNARVITDPPKQANGAGESAIWRL